MITLTAILKVHRIKVLGILARRIFIFAAIFEGVKCLSFVDKDKYDQSLQVETYNGIVQGFREKMDSGDYVNVYKSIPFAMPPLYNLRFMGPQPHVNWSGILDATRSKSCIEFYFRASGITTTGTEDCLYLNVFSPVKPKANGNLPVLFWIQGGGFLEGNAIFYNPEYFIEEDVVVVTSNYRLGMFGFLSTQDEASPGNYGLKDQNAALRWVQKNIKHFGGDPDRVTIAGQSAGACSVLYHMVSPKSKGLFHGAIAMSGTSLTPWCNQLHPKKVAGDVAAHLGLSIDNTTTFVEALRKMDSETLMNGQISPILANFVQTYQNGLVFTPVIEHPHDDDFITESSYILLKKGDFAKVPLITGVTSMETNIFINNLGLPLFKLLVLLLDLSPGSIPIGMNNLSTAQRRTIGNKIIKMYTASGSLLSSKDEEIIHYLNDALYVKPAVKTIELMIKYIPVYFYVFDYEGQIAEDFLMVADYRINRELKGVGHAEDLAYIWKSFKLNEMDKLVSRRHVRVFSNFIKNGHPTPVTDDLLQNVTWPPITVLESANYLYIGQNLKLLKNYRKRYMKFWDQLIDKYCQKSFYIYN